MTDDKLEAAIARGARAKELLGSETLKEVFAQIEADYIEGWRRTSARHRCARTALARGAGARPGEGSSRDHRQ